MRGAISNATLVVFSPRVRVADKAAEAVGLPTLRRRSMRRVCARRNRRSSPIVQGVPGRPERDEGHVDLAREFRDYVKKNPPDADYASARTTGSATNTGNKGSRT